MGTAYVYTPVSPATLQALREDPDAAEQMLYPDEDTGPEGQFDVDKAWHGLHFLLTGTAYDGEAPLRWTIFGDGDLGTDLGMGGASFLTPEQVRQVAHALAAIDESDLRRRFDPHAMQSQDIYPDVIWVRDGQAALEYVMQHFEPLVAFYAETAARGDGLVIYAV